MDQTTPVPSPQTWRPTWAVVLSGVLLLVSAGALFFGLLLGFFAIGFGTWGFFLLAVAMVVSALVSAFSAIGCLVRGGQRKFAIAASMGMLAAILTVVAQYLA